MNIAHLRPRIHLVLALVVGVTTFLAFLPALGNDFVWDDIPNFVMNPSYRSLTWSSLRWMFFSFQIGGLYQPLTWLTHTLDYAVWGLNPAGYHLTSLIIHSLNAVLLYAVSVKLLEFAFPASTRDLGAAIRLTAVFAALFWAVHPMRVEAVAWASDRSYLLPGFFYLLSIWAYLRAQARSTIRAVSLAASLALFFLSLLSKPIGAPLPVVLLAIDVFPLRRWGGEKGWCGREARLVWVEKAPYFLLSICAILVAAHGRSKFGMIASLTQWSWPMRLAQIPYSSVFYLEKVVMPLPLSPFYDALSDLQLLRLVCAIRAFVFLAITGFCLVKAGKRPAFLAAWLGYLAAISPFSGMTKYGDFWRIVSDRWSYLACLPLSVLAGAGVLAAGGGVHANRAGGKRFHKGLIVASGAILVILVGLTWSQTKSWRNEVKLWAWSVASDPNNPVPHAYLADAMADRGFLDDAIVEYAEALRLNPRFLIVYNNLGVTLARLGRFKEAAARFREALRLAPDYREVQDNLVRALNDLRAETAQGRRRKG